MKSLSITRFTFDSMDMNFELNDPNIAEYSLTLFLFVLVSAKIF